MSTDLIVALAIIPACILFMVFIAYFGRFVEAQIAHWCDGIPFRAIIKKQIVSKFGPSCPMNGCRMMELRWYGWVYHERT